MSQESYFSSFLCFLGSTVSQSFQGVMHFPRNNTVFYYSDFTWTMLCDYGYYICIE